jgi:chromate reductase, NAD(P)H dehydrogenase (quinone)
MELLLICGSLRAGSTNAALLQTAQALARRDGHTAEVFDGLALLPHFNPDDDHEPLPPEVTRLRARIKASGALLFCTPEYAGALPGSFKNLLDWTVGGGETYGKPVAWINVSAGADDAHESLRKVLQKTGAEIVEAACVRIEITRNEVAADGTVHDTAKRDRVAAAVQALTEAAAAGGGVPD